MPAEKRYHHENLRQTLLEAAVALIGEAGPRGFTLREVARRAGVSHNAPYRHFAGKDDLLLAVAREGFERLTVQMRSSLERGATAVERFMLCGRGYVEFALLWPLHFLVMFDLPADWRAHCPADGVGGDAFQVLMECVVEAQRAGDLAAGDPLQLAWTAWSLVHGIAKLAVSGNLPLDREATLGFTRHAAELLLRGMKGLSLRAD